MAGERVWIRGSSVSVFSHSLTLLGVMDLGRVPADDLAASRESHGAVCCAGCAQLAGRCGPAFPRACSASSRPPHVPPHRRPTRLPAGLLEALVEGARRHPDPLLVEKTSMVLVDKLVPAGKLVGWLQASCWVTGHACMLGKSGAVVPG